MRQAHSTIRFLKPLLNPEKHARVVDLAEVHRDAVMYAVKRDGGIMRGLLPALIAWLLWPFPVNVILLSPLEPWVNLDNYEHTFVTISLALAFYWVLPIATAIATLILVRNAILLRRLSTLESVNFCHTCRYPLERVDGLKCPECGAVRDLKAEQAETSDVE